MEYFYSNAISDNTITLSQEESHHCINVLRHKSGDIINVCGGDGTLYKCEIISATSKGVNARILSAEGGYDHQHYRLRMCVAPTKNIDRFEWFLEKATEMGVDRITPLLCDHSERKVLKTERARKIVLSAAKQSLKRVLPQVDELTGFADVIAQTAGNTNDYELKYIAFCDPDYLKSEINTIILDNTPLPADVTIMIGPEGDFSPKEIQTAIQAGYTPLSLGPARLRTETAALVSVAALYIRFASFSRQK